MYWSSYNAQLVIKSLFLFYLISRFRQHSFAGTKFYIPTNCDYCQNKVMKYIGHLKE